MRRLIINSSFCYVVPGFPIPTAHVRPAHVIRRQAAIPYRATASSELVPYGRAFSRRRDQRIGESEGETQDINRNGDCADVVVEAVELPECEHSWLRLIRTLFIDVPYRT